ncbi:tetratricopeptide repeat protein [bacterium]|nr:tetratricopeptide repeat protein [bacterium]
MMTFRIKNISAALLFSLIIGSGFAQTVGTKSDSSFWYLSLPELQSYKAYYAQELEQLQQEKMNLITRGIEDGERLLASRPDTKVLDEILARLANLYYYKEKNDYLVKMEGYDKVLQDYENGKAPGVPEEPAMTFTKSLSIYQRILDEFPKSKLVDDAVYNKAFLFEEMNNHKKANQIYMHLIEAYPESPYVPESLMRLGEYYFNPPLNDLNTAIKYYKRVLNYKNSPRYDEAVYKIGWAYYRLSKYPEAISYFTTLVEDMQAVKANDPQLFAGRIDLSSEAIEYVAISFIDFGGPQKTLEYLRGIGSPVWGRDVLEKLGDVYMKDKEEYNKAVEAYNKFLGYAPFSGGAPVVQQKIITCYQILENKNDLFFARQKLFLNYKSNTNWWKKVNDAAAKQKALELVEKAIRANFNTMVRKAEKASSYDLFREAVTLGKKYLDELPENINAYYVRWNIALILDTRLHQYKDALQEYLTISLVYNSAKYEKFAREKGLSTFKDAAENAIVVADSLVQQERRSAGYKITSADSAKDKAAEPLTSAESWLAMAFDNYLKLFPFDSSTPKVLANAGALYYVHNQFAEALKYFKTLVKYFPHSDEVHKVQFSIMESYFGKKDYTSAEALAKRMLNQNMPDSMKARVEKRLGESIFLKAQALASSGQKKEAADEFYRMALETPKIEFADRALFNAGKEFDSVGNFDSAIRAYELLKISYADSPFLKPSLNNLAIDYGQVKEYTKGAKCYEDLYSLLTKGEKARDVLFNTIVFLEKASDWVGALEKSKLYSIEYKDSPDAPDVFYKRGTYLLAMNDTTGAINFYHQFQTVFSNSPLCVPAAFEEGNLSLRIGWKHRAENSFMRAYKLWNILKDKDSEKYSYSACDGLFRAAELAEERFDAIGFYLPEQKLNNSVKQKKALLDTLTGRYTNVIAFANFRLPQSIYKIGYVWEKFADTWADQEIPVLDPTKYAVKKSDISRETTNLLRRALKSYQTAERTLEKLMKETGFTQDKKSLNDSTIQDSLKNLTNKWLEASKEKITEVLFNLAEVNRESIQHLLTAPIPSGMSNLERAEYRSQVLIKAIKPLINLVISAHYRNLQVSDSLSISTKWTKASRVKALEGLTLLTEEYEDLTFDTFHYFDVLKEKYTEKALKNGEAVPLESVNAIINMLELASKFAKATIVFAKNSVYRGQKIGVPDTSVMKIQKSIVDFTLDVSDSVETLIKSCLREHSIADSIFSKTGEAIYEDALAAYEDDIYFLQDHLEGILQQALSTEEQFASPTPGARWMAIELVKLSPDEFSKKYSVTVEAISTKPDTSWRFKIVTRKIKKKVDQKWGKYNPSMADSSFWLSDSITLSYGDTVISVQDVDTLMLLKSVDVSGIPITGKITVPPGQGISMIFNKKVLKKESYETVFPVSSLIKEGENRTIAGLMGRKFLTIAPVIDIRYIPSWALPVKEKSK